MNFHSKKMAAAHSLEPTIPAPPSRPANRQMQPNELSPGAQISTAMSSVKPSKSPRSKRPAISLSQPKSATPGAPILGDQGDQASRRAKPKKSSPDRISPAAVPGDETRYVLEPIDCASRRNSSGESRGNGAQSHAEPQVSGSPIANSSGESRGIDQSAVATQSSAVDANSHPGQAGRDAAIVVTEPNEGPQRHETLSPDQVASETHIGPVGSGDQRAQTPSELHGTASPLIAQISPDHGHRETHNLVVGAGDQGAQSQAETQARSSPLIAEITQLVRMRRRWHKAEKSLTLQGKALCRSWTAGDKDEANALYDRAADGNPDDPMLAMALAPFLDAKARFETERGAIEKTLRKLARTLPVWKAWAEGVKGLGDLRLAVIVGECGDIGSYRNPSCFWKRMGLAVIGGQRQRRVTDAADALEHGYNPERRAIAYVMSTELIKAQIRRVKDAPETAPRPAIDGVEPLERLPDAPPSIAIGPYGQLYLDRKAYEAGREGITKAHANNRAGRYLAKRVLRDLYAAWRAAA